MCFIYVSQCRCYVSHEKKEDSEEFQRDDFLVLFHVAKFCQVFPFEDLLSTFIEIWRNDLFKLCVVLFATVVVFQK